MEYVETIEREAPAIRLEAGNAVGADSVTEITWRELGYAPIGAEWQASGGGSMFGMEECATLIYRDERMALVHHWGSYHDGNGQNEAHSYLKGYEFHV